MSRDNRPGQEIKHAMAFVMINLFLMPALYARFGADTVRPE